MKGALVFVGSGIQLGRDITRRALSEIEAADRVFCMADAFMLTWLQSIRPDAESLHTCYGENKDRRQTYREMEATLLDAVREGNRVCAVFYGHPGVFADVPHAAIGKDRGDGQPVRMDPGISAEACTTADQGPDPGKRGSQSMEDTQFLVYDRQIDSGALLLLWQVGLPIECSDELVDILDLSFHPVELPLLRRLHFPRTAERFQRKSPLPCRNMSIRQRSPGSHGLRRKCGVQSQE